MDRDARRRLSKRLAYHLRHGPGDAGVELDRAGWVDLDALLAGLAAAGRRVTRGQVEQVVATSDKQRFQLSGDGRIRARYGHSVPVDLDHDPAEPPARLYHGTTREALPSIRRRGLRPRSREQVHLSTDPATARRVGGRHGAPVVLVVDARGLAAAGHTLTRAAPAVWLVDHVPSVYLHEAESS